MPPVPARGILNKAKRVGYAMNFFQQKGWSPRAAQAILGTLMQESGLNPASRGDKVRGVPTSFGIGQWHADRFTNLKRFAAAQGTDWTDFTTQLGFLHHELTAGTERANGARLMQAKDLPSAVNVMYDAWRPLASRDVEVPRRLKYARQISPTYDPNYVEPAVSPRLRQQTAMNALKLTPQEKHLYEHHLNNLQNSPLIQPNGEISTVLQAVVTGPDGRYYNIPTVWNGKALSTKSARQMAAKEGWDKWPSYKTPKEADDRYINEMHPVMEQDIVASGLEGHVSNPSDPGMMTPGYQLTERNPPPDTSEEMPPEAYPAISDPPPTPPSDSQVGSGVLKTLGQIAFPDMAADLSMPELPPIPDPVPVSQESIFTNNWRPVVPRFRERFANLFGRQGSG